MNEIEFEQISQLMKEKLNFYEWERYWVKYCIQILENAISITGKKEIQFGIEALQRRCRELTSIMNRIHNEYAKIWEEYRK